MGVSRPRESERGVNGDLRGLERGVEGDISSTVGAIVSVVSLGNGSEPISFSFFSFLFFWAGGWSSRSSEVDIWGTYVRGGTFGDMRGEVLCFPITVTMATPAWRERAVAFWQMRPGGLKYTVLGEVIIRGRV